MKTYIKKFDKLFEQTEQIIDTDNIEILYGDGLKLESINKLEKEHKIKLPKILKDYYYNFNNQKLKWHIQTKINNINTTIKGQFETLEIENALSKKVYFLDHEGKEELAFFWPENATEQDLKRIENLYPFDNLGYGYFTLFKIIEEEIQLFLFEPNFKITPLNIDLYKYLDCVLENKGIHLWQFFLIENKIQNNPYFISNFIEQLLCINPTIDLTNYYSTKAQNRIIENNYLDLFSNFENLLVTNKLFQKKKINKNAPVSLMAIHKAELTLGFALPNEIKDFYLQMNGFDFFYLYQKEDKYIVGQSKIMCLENVFGGLNGEHRRTWDEKSAVGILWQENFEEDDPDWIERMKIYNVFEYINPTLFACFNFKSKKNSFITLCEEDYSMNIALSFHQYITALFLAKGLENWQYFITEDENMKDNELLEQINQNMDVLFNEKWHLNIN